MIDFSDWFSFNRGLQVQSLLDLRQEPRPLPDLRPQAFGAPLPVFMIFSLRLSLSADLLLLVQKSRADALSKFSALLSDFNDQFQPVIDHYSHYLVLLFRVLGNFPVEAFGTAKSRLHAWAVSNNNKVPSKHFEMYTHTFNISVIILLQLWAEFNMSTGQDPLLPLNIPAMNNPLQTIAVSSMEHYNELKQALSFLLLPMIRSTRT